MKKLTPFPDSCSVQEIKRNKINTTEPQNLEKLVMVAIVKYLKDYHVKQELIRSTLLTPQDSAKNNKKEF